MHATSGANYVFCGLGDGVTGVLEELPADGRATSLLDLYTSPTEGAVEHAEAELELRLMGELLGDACLGPAPWAHADASAARLAGEVEACCDLAMSTRPHRPRVLTLYPDGVLALLGEAGVVDDEGVEARSLSSTRRASRRNSSHSSQSAIVIACWSRWRMASLSPGAAARR
ncbi:hypothetical protein [Pseudenhygromyxa sp. WMMC2535]|uniref:hypothetical protein n=1 Tax=Pseudenhygromyxa sp. WMMC2535 TaxID=2712867 RepID=UPI0020D154F8|nr:hypothetical protein [Pseudenhygromyxa sp. WMMC2535]